MLRFHITILWLNIKTKNEPLHSEHTRMHNFIYKLQLIQKPSIFVNFAHTFQTNLVDVNLYTAKSYSCDDLPNIPWDNVQHCSINVPINLSHLQNLDSIERFDDHNSDDVDATKLSYLDLPKVPFHGDDRGTDEVRRISDNNKKGTKTNDDEDCAVKCLYYTLMCCECTIS